MRVLDSRKTAHQDRISHGLPITMLRCCTGEVWNGPSENARAANSAAGVALPRFRARKEGDRWVEARHLRVGEKGSAAGKRRRRFRSAGNKERREPSGPGLGYRRG